MKLPIYLDSHATTPCDPRVVEAMLPFFTERFGNAASRQHAFGWTARDAVESARGPLAALIGAKPKDIVFTSGATESNNLAIQGMIAAARAARAPRAPGASSAPRASAPGANAGIAGTSDGVAPLHIVTVATEHRAVLDPCEQLARAGDVEVTFLPVDAAGLVDPAAVEAALRPETVLVSVMAANNEIGVRQPLAAIGAITRPRGIAFHTDAAQAAGKVPIDVESLGVDLLSFTAHKIYGPKGVGALYVRRRGPASALAPIIHGGGHERGLRSGTLNVPAIVGFAEAAAICAREMAAEGARLAALRDRLFDRLRARIEDVRLNGPASAEARLPHNLNVAFPGVDGAAMLMAMTDLAVSSGAACSSASAEPSHVLRALGLSEDLAKASLRFGLGRWTTAEEIDFAATRVSEIVQSLRARRQAIRG